VPLGPDLALPSNQSNCRESPDSISRTTSNVAHQRKLDLLARMADQQTAGVVLPRIAVIGAGVCGLVLAQGLQKVPPRSPHCTPSQTD
jgi:hypothetical protein